MQEARPFAWAFFFVATAAPAFAAEETRPSTAKYTLVQLVDEALAHNPLVQSYRARIEAERQAAAQARIWPNPSLEVSGGRRGEAGAAGPLYDVGVAQTLPISGKLGLRGDILEVGAQAWSVRTAATERAVALEVLRLGYEYAMRRQLADFVGARKKRFDLVRAYLAGRVFASPQGRAQSRLVDLRMQRLVADAVQTEAASLASRSALGLYVAFPPGRMPEVEVPWLAGTKALDEAEWTGKVVSANPELALQQLALKGAGLAETLAQREAWPDPELGAFFGQGKALETETNAGVGLRLDLPLWNRNQAGVRSAHETRRAEESALAFEERRVRVDLSRALVEYEAARQTASRYPRSLLADMDAQLKDVERELRRGRVDFLTYLELDSEVAEIAERVFAAQLNLADKIAALMAVAGEPDPLATLATF